jgi:hypothetical protein
METMKNYWPTRTGIMIMAVICAACATAKGNIYPLAPGYLNEQSLYASMQKLIQAEPDLAALKVIGFSGTENLPIYALEIGSQQAERKILLIGQHHGDEVLGMEIVIAWAEELVYKSKTDKEIKKILDNYRFWIIPTVNPEGWRVFSQGLYQNKRKNNRDTDGNGKLDIRTDGVDLNRNYPVFWDADAVVPPTHQNYKGTAPASEPEIQAVLALAQKHHFELAIFYHSSSSGMISEKIFLPWFDAQNAKQKERFDALLSRARSYAANVRKDYQKEHYEASPLAGSRMGSASNYFFHIRENGAFLIEVGGVNKAGVSVVYPPLPMKDKIVDKHLEALRKLVSNKSLET